MPGAVAINFYVCGRGAKSSLGETIMRSLALFLFMGIWGIACWPPFAWSQDIKLEASQEEPKGLLEMKQALRLALLFNPDLEGLAWEIRARDARILQAGLWPNPELELDLQDFAGSGDFNGVSQSQATFQLNQKIELGGKRKARKRLAALRKDQVNWDYAIKRMEVFREVALAFIEVLDAQERIGYAQELVRLGEKTLQAVSDRVDAGKVSPIEKVKANVALASTRMKLDQAQTLLDTARRRLSVLWENPSPFFTRAVGRLTDLPEVAPLETLESKLQSNPYWMRWSAEVETRQAALDVERSKAIPDLILKGGVRHFEETEDETFVFNMTLPLQLFDRNQGSIEAARYRKFKAEADQRASRSRIRKRLANAYNRFSLARTTVVSLKKHLLPGAQRAFEAVQEGYRFGKFNVLDLIDSQKTLFQAKLDYVDGMTALHKSAIELKSLAGIPLADLELEDISRKGVTAQ